MAKKKLSASSKIRDLLDKGMEVKKIASKLNVAPSYVHTIKWKYNKQQEDDNAPVVLSSSPSFPAESPSDSNEYAGLDVKMAQPPSISPAPDFNEVVAGLKQQLLEQVFRV